MSARDEVHASCSHCGSGNLKATTIRSAFWEGERLVVIEDIPAIVCIDCSEPHYDDRTAVLIDLLRGGGFPTEKALREITVPVFSLAHRMKSGGLS